MHIVLLLLHHFLKDVTHEIQEFFFLLVLLGLFFFFSVLCYSIGCVVPGTHLEYRSRSLNSSMVFLVRPNLATPKFLLLQLCLIALDEF